MGGTFRELVASVPTSLPALRGLLLVLKSPDERRIDLMMADLENFSLRRSDKRCVWVLYAALNGWNPFEGEWKQNPWLNRYCEAYSLAQAAHPGMLSSAYTHEQYVSILPKKARPPKSKPSGIDVMLRPIVQQDELRAVLVKALRIASQRELMFE